MKKIFLIVCLLPFCKQINAQTTGLINYEEKIKLDFKLDGADEKMMEQIPKEHSLQKELYFTAEASMYKNAANQKSVENADYEAEHGARIIIKMDESDNKVFSDLKNNQRLEKRDFMSRIFLIESELNSLRWKLTGNQKMILNYPCQEAVLLDTVKKVTAWFTPAIPVSTGPSGYSNLPGLILALNVDDGKRTVTATTIEFKEFDKNILTKPDEGKKMSKKEFDKMADEKRKEMMEANGGKGDVIIKIRQ